MMKRAILSLAVVAGLAACTQTSTPVELVPPPPGPVTAWTPPPAGTVEVVSSGWVERDPAPGVPSKVAQCMIKYTNTSNSTVPTLWASLIYESPDGRTKYTERSVGANNLLPGQSQTAGDHLLAAPYGPMDVDTPFTCRVEDVHS